MILDGFRLEVELYIGEVSKVGGTKRWRIALTSSLIEKVMEKKNPDIGEDEVEESGERLLTLEDDDETDFWACAQMGRPII